MSVFVEDLQPQQVAIALETESSKIIITAGILPSLLMPGYADICGELWTPS